MPRILWLLIFINIGVLKSEKCATFDSSLTKIPFYDWLRTEYTETGFYETDFGLFRFGCSVEYNQCCYFPTTVCNYYGQFSKYTFQMDEIETCTSVHNNCKDGYYCDRNVCCPDLSIMASKKCPYSGTVTIPVKKYATIPCTENSHCSKGSYCAQVFDDSIKKLVPHFIEQDKMQCCKFDCTNFPGDLVASFVEEMCENHNGPTVSTGHVDFSKNGIDPFKKICSFPGVTEIKIGVKIENPEAEIREIRFCDKMKTGPLSLILTGSSVSSIDLEGISLTRNSKIKENPSLEESVLEKLSKMGLNDVQTTPEVDCSNLPPGVSALKVEELCSSHVGTIKSRGYVNFSMKGDDPLKEICNIMSVTEIQIDVIIENPKQHITKLKFCGKMKKAPLSLTLIGSSVLSIDLEDVSLANTTILKQNPLLEPSILKKIKEMRVDYAEETPDVDCSNLPHGIPALKVEELCSSHGGVLKSRGYVDFSMKGDDPLKEICNITNVTEIQIDIKIENPNQTIEKLKFCEKMNKDSVSLVLIGAHVKEIDWVGVNLSNDSKVRDNFLSESILEEIRKMGAQDVQQVNEINCASLPCEIPAFVVEEKCSSHNGTLKSIGYIDFSESGDDPLGRICNFSGITEIQIKIRMHRPSREMKTIAFCDKMKDAGTSLILYGSHVKDLNVTIPLKSVFVHANKYLTNSSLHTFENDDDSIDIQVKGECAVFGESDDLDDCDWVYGDLTLNSSYTQDESHKIKGFSGCLNLDKPGLNDSFFSHLEMNTSNESVSNVGGDCKGEHVISGTCLTRILVKNLSIVLNSNISFNPASDCARVCTPYQLVVEKQDDCETVIGHIFLDGWYTAQDVKNFQAMKYLIGSITLDFTIPEDQKEGPLEFLDNLELIDSSNGGSPETDHSITLWNNLWMTKLSLPKLKKVIHHYPNFMRIRGNGFKISEEEQLKLEAKLGGREFNPADLDTSNLVTELIQVEDWEVDETNCVECSSFWICLVLLVIAM